MNNVHCSAHHTSPPAPRLIETSRSKLSGHLSTSTWDCQNRLARSALRRGGRREVSRRGSECSTSRQSVTLQVGSTPAPLPAQLAARANDIGVRAASETAPSGDSAPVSSRARIKNGPRDTVAYVSHTSSLVKCSQQGHQATA